MEIVIKPINSLNAYSHNSRTHSIEQILDISESIKNFGFNDPIEVDDSNTIISGHARFEAAKLLGLTDVPTITHSHLSDTKKKQYIIAANKIQLAANWDYDLLKDEFKDILMNGDDPTSTGFTQDEIDQILKEELAPFEGLEDDDSIPSEFETRVKTGDVWVLGEHRLMCGDCLDISQVETLISNNLIEMVYTDPPYGIDENTDRVRSKRTQVAKAGQYEKIIGDKSTQTAVDAYALCASLKIPLMLFWGANHYCHALPETGNWLVWDKRENDSQRDSNSDCELAWVKSKANSVRIFRHLWKGMIKASEQGQARCHPTQKPVALAEWSFNEYSKQNINNILDLFGGSGSTLIACEKTNRKCFMMEISPKYCDIILSRWEKFTGQKAEIEWQTQNEI